MSSGKCQMETMDENVKLKAMDSGDTKIQNGLEKDEVNIDTDENCVKSAISSAHPCYICNKEFKSEFGVRAHMRCHIVSKTVKTYLCEICAKSFHEENGLKRHIAVKHSEINKESSKVFLCEFCAKSFRDLYRLKRHLECIHNDDFTKCGVCKCRVEPENLLNHCKVKHGNAKDAVFNCNICEKQFKNVNALGAHKRFHVATTPKNHQCQICSKVCRDSFNLKRHISANHNDRYVKCESCNCKVKKQDLSEHYKQKHGVSVEDEELYQFQSMVEFEAWKETIEKQTLSRYIKKRSARVTKSGASVLKFFCHRDGTYRPRGKNIRRLKTIGSNKIGSRCTSCITVKQLQDKLSVKFIKKHTGHSVEVNRLTLSKSEKDDIACKIAMKMPVDDILENIRDSLSDEAVHRIHLTKKKDLFNIIQQYQLNDKVVLRKQLDYKNVDDWVKNMQNCSDIIKFYKPQGETMHLFPQLKPGDYCLIIMNDDQISMLEKYGNGVLCVDSTTLLNKDYDIELYTIMVLDDKKEAFPCCYMFSNRQDPDIMAHYFNTIKLVLNNDLKPKFFMSDLDESYFSGWKTVFPELFPEPKHILCKWHVDKKWRENLERIPNTTQQDEVYKQLKVLMEESDLTRFNLLSQDFLTSLFSNDETVNFATYIEKFINDPSMWAKCHMVDPELNSSMESLHRLIESIFLEGKKVKRLDKCINILMKSIRDKLFSQFLPLENEKMLKKIEGILSRHLVAQENHFIIYEYKNHVWTLIAKNKQDNVYSVTKKDENCSCSLRCEHCAACVHMYSCTCFDNSLQWMMCHHIHSVCLMKQKLPSTLLIDDVQFDAEMENVAVELSAVDTEIPSNDVSTVEAKVLPIEIANANTDDVSTPSQFENVTIEICVEQSDFILPNEFSVEEEVVIEPSESEPIVIEEEKVEALEKFVAILNSEDGPSTDIGIKKDVIIEQISDKPINQIDEVEKNQVLEKFINILNSVNCRQKMDTVLNLLSPLETIIDTVENQDENSEQGKDVIGEPNDKILPERLVEL